MFVVNLAYSQGGVTHAGVYTYAGGYTRSLEEETRVWKSQISIGVLVRKISSSHDQRISFSSSRLSAIAGS